MENSYFEIQTIELTSKNSASVSVFEHLPNFDSIKNKNNEIKFDMLDEINIYYLIKVDDQWKVKF